MRKAFLLLLSATLLFTSTFLYSSSSTQAAPVDPAATPILTYASETLLPGETANLQGNLFSVTATAWIASVTSGGVQANSEQQMVIRNQSSILIQAVVPDSLPQGMWAVSVRNGTYRSSYQYINQARAQVTDFYELSQGQSLSIYGRNLVQPGQTYTSSHVRLKTGSSTLTPTITSGDATKLVITVPAVVATSVYTLEVSNGLAGEYGYTTAPKTLTGRASSSDLFNLRVPWADMVDPSASNVYNVKTDGRMSIHAVGDGVADDLAAIQDASDRAYTDGGGVVYLPAGTYRLANDGSNVLQIRTKVVLKGAGTGSTTINYGELGAFEGWGTMIEGNYAGITNLHYENVNGANAKIGAIRMYDYGVDNHHTFLENVTVHAGVSRGVFTGDIDSTLIQDSSFDFRSNDPLGSYANMDTLSATGTNVVIRNNRVDYSLNRVHITHITHAIIENNQFVREGYDSSNCRAESGGVEYSSTEDVVINNNTVSVTGDLVRPGVCNDNEMLMSQFSIYSFDIFGSATAATSTTLTDNTKNWDSHAFDAAWMSPVILMTSGPSAGQWRKISSHTTTSVTIDHPWDLAPDATDTYTITYWSILNAVVTNNTVIGGNICILIYSGGYDLNYQHNTCTDSGPVWVQGEDGYRDPDALDSDRFSDHLWHGYFSDNALSDSDGRVPASFITTVRQWDSGSGPDTGPYWDTGIRPLIDLGNEVRRNSIDAATPNATWAGHGYFDREKFYTYPFIGGTPVSYLEHRGMVGTIHENNTLTDVTGANYVYAQGTSQSTLVYNGQPASSVCLRLSVADRPTNAAYLVKVQFRNGSSLIGRTEYLTAAADGTVTITDPALLSHLSNGATYTIWYQAAGYLADSITATGVFTGCTSIPSNHALRLGDVAGDGDNIINASDLTAAISAYQGATDSQSRAMRTFFSDNLRLADLVTLVRNRNTNPSGTP